MKRLKVKTKEFFNKSFCRRGKADYGKLFGRGISDCEGVCREYPWFYLRVFAALTVVFVIYSVAVAIFGRSGMFRLPYYFFGGAFLDIAFLVLLYELYPYKDFSLLKLLCVCIIGGSASAVICDFIYSFHSFETLVDGWKLACIAGVGEEIAKAIPTIICIAVFKKKNQPISGFLIGAAVGTWFSLTENASYIATAYPAFREIFTAVARAFGCAFSHAVWSALIGWAYCKFRRPFLNIKFYAVTLLCMALHFCIDMPLWDFVIILFAEAAVCGLVAFIFAVVVIYKERKRALTDYVETETVETEPFSPLHKANLTAVGFGAALCALLLVLSSVFGVTDSVKTVFDSEEEFLKFAHNGYEIDTLKDRKYDENYENYSEYYEYREEYGKKMLISAQQYVTDGDLTLVYVYGLETPKEDGVTEVEDRAEPDGEGGAESGGYGNAESDGEETKNEPYLRLMRMDIILEIDGEEQRFNPHIIFEDDKSLIYYPINREVVFGSVLLENGKIVLVTSDTAKRLNWQTVTILCVIAAVAVSGATVYVILRKKAKKENTAPNG